MTMLTFDLRHDVDIRRANATVKRISEDKIASFIRNGQVTDVEREPTERRRRFGREEYVHGIGVPMLRSTHVATVDSDAHTIRVCFPANYPGWTQADSYTRLRVAIYDAILHSGIAQPTTQVRG